MPSSWGVLRASKSTISFSSSCSSDNDVVVVTSSSTSLKALSISSSSFLNVFISSMYFEVFRCSFQSKYPRDGQPHTWRNRNFLKSSRHFRHIELQQDRNRCCVPIPFLLWLNW